MTVRRIRKSALAALVVVAVAVSTFARAQGHLECGSVVHGDLDRAEQHFYTFDAEAGDDLSLTMQTTGGEVDRFGNLLFGARADLEGPDAAAEPIFTGFVGNRRLVIATTGRYTLRVRSSNFWYYGSYYVALHVVGPLHEQCSLSTIQCGERIGPSLARRGEEDTIHYAGQAGERLSVTFFTTGGETDRFGNLLFGAVLEVLPPDLAAAPILSSSGGNHELVLPAAGTYSFRVYSANYYYTGSYFLDVVRLDPICDCNQNGVRDDEDLASGTSRDGNDNDVPDECEFLAWSWLEPVDPWTQRVMLWSPVPFGGGELGLGYAASLVAPAAIDPGAAIAALADPLFDADFDLALASCPPGGAVDHGITVAWIHSTSSTLNLPAGTHEIATIRFDRDADGAPGDCSPLVYLDCVGPAGAPVRNVIADAFGGSSLVATVDGERCVPPPHGRFRRGDVNADGLWDIADATLLLGCLFAGIACPGCTDARDADDDGAVGVTDAVYLFNWRFNDGTQPAAPFPLCDLDPSADELGDCLQESCL